MWRARKITGMLLLALALKALLILFAYELSPDILGLLGVSKEKHAALIAYAPEVWLSLLALVFGTLIIVVSIASESTPRLVDMFIGDPLGRLYIWVIMLSALENIYLQIGAESPTTFLSNMIFINNYVVLPVSVLLAIPYTFYILKFTKNTNVISFIFKENLQAIRKSATKRAATLERNQLTLFETVNQLHDLLQYTQFKEPKSDVICRLGMSVRIYLKSKKNFPDRFFKLNRQVREDISFRTLQEKYEHIEREKYFYEQKVLKVFNAMYLLLISEGHIDLASLCANELVEIGDTAIRHEDHAVTDAVVLNFNTLLRYGINHALKSREVRNAYNVIYYYNQLVHAFMERRDEERIERCCHFFGLYAEELTRLRLTEPQLNFLVDAITWELKKNLIYLHENAFPRKFQRTVLNALCNLKQHHHLAAEEKYFSKNGIRLIKVSLCLYYIGRAESVYVDALLDSMIRDLRVANAMSLMKSIDDDCETLRRESETFWEETDRGNINIYFSDQTDQIPRLQEYVQSRIRSLQFVTQ